MLKYPLIWLVRLYQVAVSPLLPRTCRFYPSCSAYAHEALKSHGAGRGAMLAVKRLLRCHPFGEGGVDPVPVRRGPVE
ncbi:MAG: membrane protein insertion efficiency factor YidD [Thermodesulfobacteriota bacterium]